jgi:hypothetical protein
MIIRGYRVSRAVRAFHNYGVIQKAKVKMISKVNFFLFRCFTATWVIYWITSAGEGLARALRYNQLPNLWAVGWELFIATLSCVLFWKYVRQPPWRPTVSLDFSPILSRLLKVSENISYLASCAVFLFFIAFFGHCSFCHGSYGLSAAMDSIGVHELAERIFILYPEREFDQSVASSHTFFNAKEEEVETRMSRNDAVRKVYGAHSVQMARRCDWIGSNLDTFSTKENWFQSFRWHQTAAELYELNDRTEQCIRSLMDMAAIKLQQKQFPEVRAIIKKAAPQLTNPSLSANEKYRLGYGLAWYAKAIGDKNLESALMPKTKPAAASYTTTAEDNYALPCYALLLISCSLTVGALPRFISNICLRNQFARWNTTALTTSDMSTRVRSLNNLIAIELYRQNISTASRLSLSLLRTVGEDSACGSVPVKGSSWSQLKNRLHLACMLLILLAFFAPDNWITRIWPVV